MKKNKACPMKRVCRDECYGENPCCFAKAFDGLQRKVNRLQEENKSLKETIDEMKMTDDLLW